MPIFWLVVWLAIVLGSIDVALAHFTDHDKWAQLTPRQRDWLMQQVVPKSGGYRCCSVADADEVEEDIRDNHYWVRSAATHGIWIAVPDDVIITEPNVYGRPVVWWKFTDGLPQVRCYAPGALL